MMGEEVEGFEARSMTTIRAGNADGRAGRFKRAPTSFDAALTRWDSTHRPRRAQRLTQPVRPRYLIVGESTNAEMGPISWRHLLTKILKVVVTNCGIAQ